MIILTILFIALPVILIVALFTKEAINAEGTLTIDQPQQQILERLSHPEAQITSKLGKASVKAGNVIQNTIELVISYEKPIQSQATLKCELKSIGNNQTQVNWFYNGNPHPNYIIRVLHLLFGWRKPITKTVHKFLRN